MGTTRVTEETISNLLADGKMTPAEFGLRTLEIRRYGACHPSDSSPCEHTDDTCTMVQDTYGEDSHAGDPHCDLACPNLWDVGGAVEGIGGEYETGGTFSYISDDESLSERVYARAAELSN